MGIESPRKYVHAGVTPRSLSTMKKLILGTLATTACALTLPFASFAQSANQGSATSAADTSTTAADAHTSNTDPSGHTGGASADQGSGVSVSGTSTSAMAYPDAGAAPMPNQGTPDSSSGGGTAAMAHTGDSDPGGHTTGAGANQTSGTNSEMSK